MQGVKNIRWSPENYEAANVIGDLSGEELISRLSWLALQPTQILDLACGLGKTTATLANRYTEVTRVAALDENFDLLQAQKQLNKILCIQADVTCLPIKNQSIDLVVANQFIPWQTNLQETLQEWQRVLKRDGVLLFSSLGPDCLKEWQGIFKKEHLPNFLDMHDIGDMLLKVGLSDPVLDVEHVTLCYEDKSKLLTELVQTGMWFPDEITLNTLLDDVAQTPSLEITYEIVYGHAFNPQQKPQGSDKDFAIPLATLREQLKRNDGKM